MLRASQQQERHLTTTIEHLLARAHARGDRGLQRAGRARRIRPIRLTFLAFLVNKTILELSEFVGAAQRRADEDRRRLEQLVEERTAGAQDLGHHRRAHRHVEPASLLRRGGGGARTLGPLQASAVVGDARPRPLQGDRRLLRPRRRRRGASARRGRDVQSGATPGLRRPLRRRGVRRALPRDRPGGGATGSRASARERSRTKTCVPATCPCSSASAAASPPAAPTNRLTPPSNAPTPPSTRPNRTAATASSLLDRGLDLSFRVFASGRGQNSKTDVRPLSCAFSGAPRANSGRRSRE